MDFIYKKETNVKIGQKLYGIIAMSLHTCNDVYPITIDYIDYNEDLIIFTIDQPCKFVCCNVEDMKQYVFESEEEAKNAIDNLDSDEGIYVY